jgi:outer membrane receptor protein involved in Fe transport
MRTGARSVALWFAVGLVCAGGPVNGQGVPGEVDGRVLTGDGSPIPGVHVTLDEASRDTFSGPDGRFLFPRVPAGRHSLQLTLANNGPLRFDIDVSGGSVTTVERIVDWKLVLTDVIVVGPSRQPERLVDAPAAAAIVSQEEIERKAMHGQVAKLIEFTPGAQVAQSGLWDFNIGTRGFNRALSRRVAVVLDGRDLSLPFFGYQGWGAFSFPLDDLSGLEMVRGPDAALYGSNSSGGVIAMRSKEPRLSQGGMVRVGGGERDTLNVEARWAGKVGRRSNGATDGQLPLGWYARAVGGVRRSNGFAVSRVNGPEYSVACDVGGFGDCLPGEVVAFDGENTEVVFGGIRLDRYLNNGILVTAEGGYAQGAFGVFQAQGQRAKSVGKDGKRPWARLAVKDDRRDRFDVAATYDGYYEPSGYIGLSTGRPFNSDAYRVQLEGRAKRNLRNDTVRITAGATASVEKMDSFNASAGGQTFLFRPVTSDRQALFALGTWGVTPRLRVLLAARGDWGSLYTFQLSPKASASYSLYANHTVRVTYSGGFQSPNSLEYFLRAEVAPPVDLSAFNAFCSPFGVNCRFGATPVLALGNEDLRVEHVRTWEVGYTGAPSTKTVVTAEYYRSHSSHLATSLLPQIGTALGRLNPRFGPWRAPSGLPGAIAEQIRTLVPILSNDASGSNILAAASYAEFASADTQGVDAGLHYEFRPGWRAMASYSWFDFQLPESARAAEGLLLPNASPNSFTVGVAFARRRLAMGIDTRWLEHFRWADGYFLGEVPSYSITDVTARYPVSPAVDLSLNISNLFNDRHWESFGGALLRRRVLAGVQYHW